MDTCKWKYNAKCLYLVHIYSYRCPRSLLPYFRSVLRVTVFSATLIFSRRFYITMTCFGRLRAIISYLWFLLKLFHCMFCFITYCHVFQWIRRGFELLNRFIGSSLAVTTISYTIKITVTIAHVTSHTKSSNSSSGHIAVPLQLRNWVKSIPIPVFSHILSARTTHRKHSSIVA
jgi:hypothetical protein